MAGALPAAAPLRLRTEPQSSGFRRMTAEGSCRQRLPFFIYKDVQMMRVFISFVFVFGSISSNVQWGVGVNRLAVFVIREERNTYTTHILNRIGKPTRQY